MKTTITAKIKGMTNYPHITPKPYELEVAFTLYQPKGDNDYGTGYYMGVDVNGEDFDYVDVRYAGTTDIKALAEDYIKGFWGNVTECNFAE